MPRNLESRLSRLEAKEQPSRTALTLFLPAGASEEQRRELVAAAEAEHGPGHSLTILLQHFGSWPPQDGRLSWAQPLVG
jgi:hypothetical protein